MDLYEYVCVNVTKPTIQPKNGLNTWLLSHDATVCASLEGSDKWLPPQMSKTHLLKTSRESFLFQVTLGVGLTLEALILTSVWPQGETSPLSGFHVDHLSLPKGSEQSAATHCCQPSPQHRH